MRDIERELAGLGERAGDLSYSAKPLSPHALHRIRLRRFGATVTALTVIAVLGAGGATATNLFDESPKIAPADPAPSPSAPAVFFAASEGQMATLAMLEGSGTVCYLGDLLTDHPGPNRAAIVHHEDPATAVVELIPGDEISDVNVDQLGGSEGVCVTADNDALADIIVAPDDHRLLVESVGTPRTIARLVARESDEMHPGCGAPVGFEPTYLPRGWARELQPGDAVGTDVVENVIGHYGASAPPGSDRKFNAGFVHLVARAFPPAPASDSDLVVLGHPTTVEASGETGKRLVDDFLISFAYEDCSYWLISIGLSKDEVVRFAEGLRPTGPQSIDQEPFAAVWPEDTAREAAAACAEQGSESRRKNPISVALNFADAVLGWLPSELNTRDATEGHQRIEIFRPRPETQRRSDGASIYLFMTEVVPDCWSVGSVGRPPDNRPTGAGISVRGRDVHVGFDDLGAVSVDFEIGHGDHVQRLEGEEPDGEISLRLDYEPDETGHFLILFRDADGRVFSAAGGTLPAGDFAAG